MVAGSVAARTWRRRLAVGAARARHGVYDLDLFAVDAYDPMADVDEALYAGAGTLEAGVVRLYGVVVLLGRWVRVGCARLLCGHEVPPRGPGPGVLHHPRGHFRFDTHILTQVPTNIYKYGRIFPINYRVMEINLEKLRLMRIDQGLSQRQLSLKAGLSAGAVAVVEQRGRAHPDTLKKIADVLHVRASELIKE
jgi:DNA-binding Xre family transcriptional regulator